MTEWDSYVEETVKAIAGVDKGQLNAVEAYIDSAERLFIVGVGGNASDAIHAASDFRKLCGIPTFTIDISEVTARANDEGWDTVFRGWLQDSGFTRDDTLLVLSVGGGTPQASVNIAEAVRYARGLRAPVIGITGPDGGVTAFLADACVCIPAYPPLVTPLTHGIQGVILHYLFTRLFR